MIKATDKTFDSILNEMIVTKTVVVLSGTPSCKNCQLSHTAISDYKRAHKDTSLEFITIDSSSDDIVESRFYQMNEMSLYPKTVIYIKDQISFFEGEITIDKLKEFENLAQKT